jgi:hypothetical protein
MKINKMFVPFLLPDRPTYLTLPVSLEVNRGATSGETNYPEADGGGNHFKRRKIYDGDFENRERKPRSHNLTIALRSVPPYKNLVICFQFAKLYD